MKPIQYANGKSCMLTLEFECVAVFACESFWVLLRRICIVFFFSAVKCYDEIPVLEVLRDCGASFDCASKVS